MTKDLNLNAKGATVLVSRKDLLQQQIRNVVLTARAVRDLSIYGERYGVPLYGCSATVRMWEHINDTDNTNIIDSIYEALKQIPDIEVFWNDIDVKIEELQQTIEIVVYYKDLTTNKTDKAIIKK